MLSPRRLYLHTTKVSSKVCDLTTQATDSKASSNKEHVPHVCLTLAIFETISLKMYWQPNNLKKALHSAFSCSKVNL